MQLGVDMTHRHTPLFRAAIGIIALVTVGVLGLASSPAHADFTETDGSGEMNFREILDGIYNNGVSTFTGEEFGGGGYTSGIGISAYRVDDFGSPGGSLNIITGHGNTGTPGSSSALDQLWNDGIATITGEAKFAYFSQAFGYTDAGGYHELFEVPVGHSGFFEPVIQIFNVDLTGPGWRWDRSDANGDATPGARHWSSDQSLNTDDHVDHLITYEILGLGGNDKTWLLFWDDQHGGGDRDFNDLVVEIRAAVVPAPAAAWLGLLGLTLVSLSKRRL